MIASEEKKMNNIEELKKKFIVDDEDVLKARLEPIIAKALAHCQMDKKGQVRINTRLSGKEQVKLVLAARAIASQMDSSISPEVGVDEISKFTGLPANQVRARVKDAVEDRFAQFSKAGVYRALPHKVEGFLDSITQGKLARA
jgi:hypothetical protein